MFTYVGGGGETKRQHMFTKWRLLCWARRKDCQGGFSFLSLHLWSKYTFEDLANEQEMCSRMLEGKEMGFKVLKVTMSPIWTTSNRSVVARVHKTNYSEWTLYGLGKGQHFINFRIGQWCSNNLLLLNPSKTKLMIFSSRQIHSRLVTPRVTFIGVILDTNLIYDEHITKTVFSCMSCLSQIIHTKHVFDKRTLLTIINAFVSF